MLGFHADFRRLGGIAGMLFLLTAGSAANADTAAIDPNTGAPVSGYASNIPVSVPVKAKITVDCGFDPTNGPDGNVDAGELNGSFTDTIYFNLRCPTPLNVAVVSDNGGLLISGSPTIATGYTGTRDYSVELFLQGSTTSNSSTCLASDLVATTGTCEFRGPAAAGTSTAAGVGLHLDDYATNGAGYVSGSYLHIYSSAYGGSNVLLAADPYNDTLTVTFHAAI